MCGVCGIYGLDGPLNESDAKNLELMKLALAHRGPDGSGVFVEERVALGHTRLSILDTTDDAAQPMAYGTKCLSYNGEVYNFRELRAELEADGISFRSNGDTEVVLHALRYWGPEAAVRRFDGMFAFAYFDLESNTLWLGRDRLGIKPMSYIGLPNRFLFASEDKAFLPVPEFRSEIDDRRLSLRLLGLGEGNGSSLLRGVRRLSPGCLLRVNESGIEERHYWHPLDVIHPRNILSRPESRSSRVDQLDALLAQSVAMHLASDRPVAFCLSGGVDSGLIAAIAAKQGVDVASFVADPMEGPNERVAAQRTADHVGASLFPVSISNEEMLRSWPDTIFALESYGYSQSHPALFAITRACKRMKFPVLLTGEGSDELFGGYDKYRSTAKQWRRLDVPWKWFVGKRSRERLLDRHRRAPFSNSLVLARSRRAPPWLEVAAPEIGLLPSKYLSALNELPRYQDRALIAHRLYDLSTHLQELLMRHDRIGMANSVETRVPYLENALIEFGLNLRPCEQIRGKTGKVLLKRLAERYIPRQNIYKDKLGFPVTPAYSRGAEKLLHGGMLGEVMNWTRRELENVAGIAREDDHFRVVAVGAELYVRMFADGQTRSGLSETLISMKTA